MTGSPRLRRAAISSTSARRSASTSPMIRVTFPMRSLTSCFRALISSDNFATSMLIQIPPAAWTEKSLRRTACPRNRVSVLDDDRAVDLDAEAGEADVALLLRREQGDRPDAEALQYLGADSDIAPALHAGAGAAVLLARYPVGGPLVLIAQQLIGRRIADHDQDSA